MMTEFEQEESCEEREEESECVTHVPIHQASGEVLQPTRKALQKFCLLKKGAENDCLTAKLNAKKQEFEERMERVAQCREELYEKDQNNRTQAYEFQIYLKEWDLKKQRALEKFNCEQKNNAVKRQEIHKLKREIKKMKIRQKELQKKLDKYKSYEHFMKKIINMLPPDFWGYQEDAVIQTLIQRHQSLFSTKQKLKKHLFTQQENVEKLHNECAAVQEEHSTMRFVLNGKISELQSKYNALKERNTQLIHYIDNKEGLTNDRIRVLSRMVVGISNMAEHCYSKRYGPLKQMTLESKLNMIQEFICEKTEIKEEIMKPVEYKSSSRLFKRRLENQRSDSK